MFKIWRGTQLTPIIRKGKFLVYDTSQGVKLHIQVYSALTYVKHPPFERILFTDHDGGVKNEIWPLYDAQMDVLNSGSYYKIDSYASIYPSIESFFFPDYAGDVFVVIWYHGGVKLQIYILKYQNV